MVGPPRINTGRPLGSRSFEPRSAAVFGRVLRESRLAKGMSQEALAHQAELERAHIGRMERGENQPTLWVVLKLAEGLGIKPGVLVDQVAAEVSIKR